MENHDRKTRKRRAPPEREAPRALRLQELIREEMNLLLQSEVRDQRLEGVFITMVELAGECARLWYSAPPDHGDASAALEGAAGFLRSRLAEALGLKRTPDLRFRRDPVTRTHESERGN
jgi:ribosome-binding factor A